MSDIENRIDAVLLPADKVTIITAVKTIDDKLPFARDLSSEDRRSMLKLSTKNVDFVNLALEVATQNPDFLPRAFDLPAMQKDVELLVALRSVLVALEPVFDKLNDTYMVVGSEAYAAALEVYRYAKQHKHGDGLDPLLDSLGKAFVRKATPKSEPVAEPTA